MSNTLAVTAVTTALRDLLLYGVPKVDDGVDNFSVTSRTPDNARKDVTGTSLNLFLYRTVVNAAWQNGEPSPRVRAGESRLPPLPLNLHYLLTAYGPDDVDMEEEAMNHRVLGAAMSVLHDQPILSADDLAMEGSDLAEQPERVRITAIPLSIDDISKLWSAFQSQYRISAAYEVAVVLIDSNRPSRSPLPVLRRGEDDTGPAALTGAVPYLREIRAPRRRSAAMLGDELTIVADALGTTDTTLRFQSTTRTPDGQPALARVDLQPTAGSRPGEVVVTIRAYPADPDALGRWAPGHYAVSAALTRDDAPTIVNTEINCDLAPTITVDPNSTGSPVQPGDTLTLTCAPRILDRQRVQILFGDIPIEAASLTNPDPASPEFKKTPTTLTCVVPDVDAGRYLVRLRVDDVDSVPRAEGMPPTFDPRQQVVVS